MEAANDGYREEDSLVQRALSLALAPVRILTSRSAIKAYLSTLLFLTTSTILLTVSSAAYGFFYYNYIPQINLERVIYLQYGQGPYPYATIVLDASALISQQAYDVELILDMPRTATNLDAGNFMLDLSLLGQANVPDAVSSWLANITSDNVLYHSRRPAILPYTSPILSLAHTFLYLPWHLLNFRDLDSSHLVVPMFEMLTFPRGTRNIPTHARVELQSSTTLQVYDAILAFRAKFQGMRYLVYNYRATAFVIFTTLFYTISVSTMALAWTMISHVLSTAQNSGDKQKKINHQGKDSTMQIKPEGEPSSTTKIKTEDETESSAHGLSLSAEGADTDGREEDLTRTLGPDEAADDEDEGEEEEIRGRPFEGDSGIGTSMESESGLKRRRSSRGFSKR